MANLSAFGARPAQTETNQQDPRAVEEGGTDAAFVNRNTTGGTGNDPAAADLLESAERGADYQTELNEQSNVAAAQGAVLESAHVSGVDSGDAPAGSKTWTSHPIGNYALGNFQFENGTLTLDDSEEIAKFESMLNDKNLPARDKALIQEVNVGRANQIAADFLAQRGRKTSGIDHSDNAPQA
jgi:hypothetical protein